MTQTETSEVCREHFFRVTFPGLDGAIVCLRYHTKAPLKTAAVFVVEDEDLVRLPKGPSRRFSIPLENGMWLKGKTLQFRYGSVTIGLEFQLRRQAPMPLRAPYATLIYRGNDRTQARRLGKVIPRPPLSGYERPFQKSA